METLLPSEVARLVLGYLEEEKCSEAAKCFLECSHHLNEYRILAQKGRKYPTKVNGCSLKEVLEEYCLVHSIVQESLSSMTEQPNGGTLIDNLRYVVRHCQPVQVHINLHPQGQNTSTSKSDMFDSSTGSVRPRSRKTTLSQGQAVETMDQTSISQPALNSTSKENSSAEGLITISTTDTHLTTQPLLQLQPMASSKKVCTRVNQNANVSTKCSSSSQSHLKSCLNSGSSSHSDQNDLPECNSTFQIVKMDTHQEQHPLITTTQQSESSHILRSSQQLLSSATDSNHEAVIHTGAEYLPLEGVETHKDFPKPEKSNHSFVTKYYGSSIVFLDNNTLSEPCVSQNLPFNNSIQENYDSKRPKIPTPMKPQVDPKLFVEKVSEKLLNNQEMISKLVENINSKIFTPAKQSDDSTAVSESLPDFNAAVESAGSSLLNEPYLDEFLQEFLQFDHNVTMSSGDESEVVVSQNPKKNKSMTRKSNTGVCKLKQLCENAVSNISGDGTPSKQSLVKLINSTNFTVPERATPAKGISDGEVLTPMTKLLKSITSPSGELYLEPTQFANLIDLPPSATKCKDQTFETPQVPTQFSQPLPLPLNSIIEVPRLHGPPLHIPIVNCNPTEVAEYSNQEGVSTLSTGTFEVMNQHGSFKPIVPKLRLGDVLPPVTYEIPQSEATKKRQQRKKGCTTRGGRQSNGQSRKNAPEKTTSMADTEDLVTIYGADGEECKTVSYSSSSDLPILVSDTPDVATEVQTTDNCDKDLPKITEDELNNDGDAELECVAATSDVKESSVMKEEENCLPPLNASIIRNTPGFNGPPRATEKRMSFSTPRRRLSHIRALDFNTPPKENDQSTRRANTSPKNMSTNALSPNTTGKSIKSSAMGSLFKAPGEGLRRTSKVKAHLFKSPEYPMTLSSGYKVPSAAVTSTPSEASCSKYGDSIPTPSGAWDKIGGVSLILDSGVSPVKRVEPQCKKELKSWDADLRSLLNSASEPQPLPKEPPISQPTQKRKAPPTAQRKRVRAKKNQKTEDNKKPKEEEVLAESNKDEKMDESIVDQESIEKSCEKSTASDCEMAKMLENNLLDATSEGMKRNSPLKSTGTPSLISEKNSEIRSENNVIEENAPLNESLYEKPALSETVTESNCLDDTNKALSQSDQSNVSGSESNPKRDLDTESNAANAGSISFKESMPCNAQTSKEAIDKYEDSTTGKKVSTPVSDGLIGSAVDKSRLTQVSFKESFSFETPMKDNPFANMIPQTPCFLDPSSQSIEDTPRTKIIKAIPVPMIPSAENSESTMPTVPPTPTIRITPSGSPNCVSYFQPKESPSRRTQMFKNSPKKSFDNLSSILVQECNRLEASGMRELAKKTVIESSEKSGQKQTTTGSKDDLNSSKNVRENSDETEHSGQEIEVLSTEPSLMAFNETLGCARLLNYKRKTLGGAIHKLIKNAQSEPSSGKNGSSDETEDCMIVSPQKATVESTETADKITQPALEERSESYECECTDELSSPSQLSQSKSSPEHRCADQAPTSDRHSSSSTSPSFKNVNAEIQEAQEVLGMKIFGNKVSIAPSKSPQPLQKQPTSPAVVSLSEGKQPALRSSVGLAISNFANLNKNEASSPLKKSLKTPVKVKNMEKSKPPSSKKKTLLGQNRDPVLTDDDESTDSSSSGSSSDSDSDSSSSSSSEEGTPVKENVSPEKKPTPLKSRTRRSSEKIQPKSGLGASLEVQQVSSSKPPQAEIVVSITEGGSNMFEVVDSSQQVPEEDVASASVNLELKSLIETKDMGTCQRIANSRSAHSTKAPDIIHEMQEKRKRTLELLKSKSAGRCALKNSKDKVLNPFATENKPQSVKLGIVSEGNQVTVADKQLTKELNLSSDVPKKRLSKSDTEKSPNETESQVKRRSASDSTINANSDDDQEYVLRLSGDEKDELLPETSTQPPDEVDKQVAAMHGDDSSVVMLVHGKPTVVGTKKFIDKDEKVDQLTTGPAVCVKDGKFVVRNSVSSKAADVVLKTLLEKGFGCPLPPPPTDKIKKLPPTIEKTTSTTEKKDRKIVPNEERSDKVKSTTVQTNHGATAEKSSRNATSTKAKSDKKAGPTSGKPDEKKSKPNDTINQNKRSSSKGNSHPGDTEEQHFDGDDEDEVCVEKINTSLSNTMELKLTYKGLGPFFPKRETYIAKPLKMIMAEGQPICLAPSEFVSLFGKAPRRQTPMSDSAEKQRNKSMGSNIDSTPKSNSSRRESGNRDSDSRARTLWDSGPSRRQDRRSRRNRSPSPRYKRDSHYFNDRGSTRDTHRSQDYNPRRDRRHEAHSSHHKSSESESRPGESSSSRLKPVEREDAEDGEIISSDSSDFEVKTNNRRRKARSPPYKRPDKRRAGERKTTTEKGSKEGEQRYQSQHSPQKVKRTTRRVSQSVPKVSMTESSEREIKDNKRSVSEKQTGKLSTANEEKLGKDSRDEDVDDIDLDDDTSFPVLGDYDADENCAKEVQPNSSNENNQSGMVTRRRAPPRSVNAHKVSTIETSTPIQKGKRKLSTSPDVASEDSCNSVQSSTNPDGEQVKTSKKAAVASAAPAAKISKPNNKGEKVAETEIIKNLDVESFLSKLHG